MKMKSLLMVGAGLAASSLALTPLLAAQNRPGRGGGVAGRPAAAQLRAVVRSLDLSAEQRSQLVELRVERRQEVRSIRRDADLTRRERVQQVRGVRREGRQEMRAVLTPEQREQLAERRAQNRTD